MSLPKRADVVDLEWDERNIDHIANHVDPFLVEEMFIGGNMDSTVDDKPATEFHAIAEEADWEPGQGTHELKQDIDSV